MKVALYCGSSHGNNPLFTTQTKYLAKLLAEKRIDIIYGGGKVGLMGILADTAINAGVHVIGVMPRFLVDHELAHPDVHQLLVVDSMHERKAAMAQHADAFIALPGGPGTMEEIFEAWTWAQLGLHNKPCAFLNIDGYFNEIIAFFDKMILKGFMNSVYKDMLVISADPDDLLAQIEAYQPPQAKWLNRVSPK